MPQDPRKALPVVHEVPDLYWYRCEIAKEWKDADTVFVHFDHGRKIWQRDVKLRLARIDAFGSNSPKKAEGAQLVNTLLPVGNLCYVRTVENTLGAEKQEKWGRYLAEVYLQVDHMGPLMNLGDLLVKQGLALYWEGEGLHPTGEIVK